MRHDPALRRTAKRRGKAVPSPAKRRVRGISAATLLSIAVALGVYAGIISAPSTAPSPSAPSSSSAPAPTARLPTPKAPGSSAAKPIAAGHFTVCAGRGRTNCVVDGDTFWIAGEKIRMADIDAPETHPPRCPAEAALGKQATLRLQALLNAGPVTLADADRPADRYGRRLAIPMRNGQSLGEILIEEGLARPWEGRRRPWCAG